MATLLATKATQEVALATDDEAHEQLVTDPTVAQFSSGDTTMASTSTGFGGGFGNASANISSSGTSTFGSASTGGFGSSSSVGSPTPTSSGFSGGGFGSSSSSTSAAPAGPQPALTGAGSNAAQGADVLVANDNTDWINKKWRPVMGWMYMVVCVCDFTVFPILWSLLQAISHGQVTSQWQPVTLQGAGLFHVAMGAVLGIAAYGRTKEKVAGAA